jgi:hypothetical protein
MQLLIKRGQEQLGVFSNKRSFTMMIRAQYTEEERALINKYELGGAVIYDSAHTQGYLDRAGSSDSALRTIGFLALAKMGLSVTVASLQKGHQIQCADLAELLECENAIIDACKNVRNFISAAETFDGREIVVDLDEEPVAH